MAIFKCKMCGGDLNVTDGASVCTCAYCGTKQTLPKLGDEKRVAMFERANYFWRNNEFDKAMGIYEMVLATDDTDAEAYWSIVLCRYGIEYVEDPKSHKRVPTVNRFQTKSILRDEDYLNAIRCANGYQRDIFETEAAQIDTIQKNISTISKEEKPYDVFICYKETDGTGARTHDSVYAQKIYDALSHEGLRVFFSRITLEDKIGTAYEPYIYAALHSAKVMLVVSLSAENMNAPWVKNEWDRYLSIAKQDSTKALIPCYKDMSPYDMPEEFTYLQAQDMGKIGFLQDLVRGVKKVSAASAPALQTQERAVQTAGEKAKPLLERAYIFLEDGNWKKANQYAEKVLDLEPKNTDAYLCKFLAAGEYLSFDRLQAETSELNKVVPLDADFFNAVEFANEKQKAQLDAFLDLRTEAQYQNACRDLEQCKYKKARLTFDLLGDYKDAAAKIVACDTALNTLSEKRQEVLFYQKQGGELQNRKNNYDDIKSDINRQIDHGQWILEQMPEEIKETKKVFRLALIDWLIGCCVCICIASFSSASTLEALLVLPYYVIDFVFLVLWTKQLKRVSEYTENKKKVYIALGILCPPIVHAIAMVRSSRDIDDYHTSINQTKSSILTLQDTLRTANHEQQKINNDMEKNNVALQQASDVIRSLNLSKYESLDPLLEEAGNIVIDDGKASASVLQRKMDIGYGRATALMDQLEQIGLISPQDGAKAQKVQMNKQQWQAILHKAGEVE